MYKALVLLTLLGLVAARPDLIRFYRSPSVKQCEPQPDPLPVPAGPVNLSLTPILEIFEGSSHQGAIVGGLPGATIDIGIIIITLQLTFNIHIPTLDVDAMGVAATGYVDTRPLTSIPVGNFSTSSSDDSSAAIRNLRVRGNAALFINIIGNRVSIRTMNIIELSFNSICMDLGANFMIGGATPDWDDLCANLKSRFDAEWANSGTRDQAIEKIRVTLNVIVGQYTLAELIDLIGGGDGGEPEPCLLKKN